jgi:hypothetical protein
LSSKSANGNGRRNPAAVTATVEQPTTEDVLDLKDYPGFDTIFTETRDQLIRQLGRMDSLDNKTGIIAGFDGVIVTAAAGSLAGLQGPIPSPPVWPAMVYRVPVVVLTLGVMAVLVSFLCAIKAYRIRTYSEVIKPREAYDQWLTWSAAKTRTQLLHNMIDANEQNETALKDKVESIKTSTWALLAGVSIFSLAVVLHVIIHL